MPTSEQVASSYYRQQRRISKAAVRSAVAQWNRLDPANLVESWLATIGRIILALITQAQQAAAQEANPYLADLAVAQGVALSGSALVVADAFAGVASDGRALETLLDFPVILTKKWISDGRSVPEAMAHGRSFLALLASTQVADAGRAAVSAGMTAEKTWVSYVRHVVLPACSRCIVLAGREYSFSTGFQRHPMCDCVMTPRIYHADGSVGGPDPASPNTLFEQMTAGQQDKAFGAAGAQAIRLGGDIGQVVNARRGMRTATMYGRTVQFTTEGTTNRGFAGRRMIEQGARTRRQAEELATRLTRQGPEQRQIHRQRVQIPRLMPEQILKEANGDRDQAIRLLRRFGYIA